MLPLILHGLLVLVLGVRILLRRHRQPESRVAWLLVVFALPYLGALLYLLLGETDIGERRAQKLRKISAGLPEVSEAPGWGAPESRPELPELYEPLFRVGRSISGFDAIGGNSAELMEDSDTTIARMVADIDAARDTVHILFYIWLDDHNGTKMLDAVKRAAGRGVKCRVMVDDVGSHALVRSDAWKSLAAAGARTAVALRIGFPLLPMYSGRIDLRNHRKIVVIDNGVTYCGSQNCADPAFLPKAKYGPWVDAVMRFEGPVVRQNQRLFCVDWMEAVNEDLSALLREPMPSARPGFAAQAVATGPTARYSAMPEMFESIMYAARRTLFITTPYYVPDPAIQAALCAAAYRGVETRIIFPARNDDFAVGAASRSYYLELLKAGVRIFEFAPGLLHTKSITLDDEIMMIGSANMDRRSFDLNYENNILLADRTSTAAMLARQESYLRSSREITLEEVEGWSIGHRLANNLLAIAGPVL